MENLPDKSKNELSALLIKKRQELMEFRFFIKQGKVKDNKKGQKLKKEIARILTMLDRNKS